MSTQKQQSWKPTNKWLAAQCTGVATLAIAWVNAGGWTKPLTIALIGLVSQATAAYLVSNADPSADASEAESQAAGQAGGGLVSPSGASVQTTAA
jgi:hypothetical protein